MPESTRTNVVIEEFAWAVRRARAEFLEMPGLLLTEAQAARLWAVDERLCHAVLAHLVDRHFLARSQGVGVRARVGGAAAAAWSLQRRG